MAVKLSGTSAILGEALALIAPHLPTGAPSVTGPFDGSNQAEPRPLPVLGCLAELPDLSAAATRRLVEGLVAVAPDLCWRQTYDGRNVPATFLDRYGWAELLGPYGAFACDHARLGLLLLGRETLYPSHAHAAEELYLVLAGTADWRGGDGPWQPRPPGTAIHHPPHLPHAMRTSAEPMLAMYLWWGAELAVHAKMVAQ